MADELADGTYVVRNGAFPEYSLNSSGATDVNGANVWCYPFDNTDAAFVTIWTRSDGTRQIVFPATGKSLDLAATNYYAGVNVEQWEDNDSKTQQWTITPAPNKTYTFEGKEYRGYHIYLTETLSSDKYCVELSGTPTNTDDNDHPNVVLTPAEYTSGTDDANSDDRYWFFVPANPVPTGTYRIRPAVNFDLVLEVEGNNLSSGAWVRINTENGGNNQVWVVRNDASSGRSRIVATHSMQLMEIANLRKDPDTGEWKSYDGSSFGNGSWVCQSPDDDGDDQWWVIVPAGYGTWNGNNIPLYTIHNAASEGTSHLLDVYGDNGYPGNYLEVWAQTGSAAQKFFFEPWTMLDKHLGTPSWSEIGLSTNPNSGARGTIFVGSSDVAAVSGKLYCLWNCRGKTYKARYRCRTRSVGASSYGSWGRWYSMADNSSANNGLGDIWKPNVTSDGVTKHSPVTLSKIPTVDNIAYDDVEVECEIQRFEANWTGVDLEAWAKVVLASSNSKTTEHPGTWIKQDGKWWYRHADGNYTKDGWEQIDGKWYLFDADGWMLTGWHNVGGKWYYLSDSGAMATGWIRTGNTWSYLDPVTGAMHTADIENVGGRWYAFSDAGDLMYSAESDAMATGSGLSAHGEVMQKAIHISWKPTLTISELGWTPDGLIIKYSSDYKHDGNSIKLLSVYDATLGQYIVGPDSRTNEAYIGGVYTWTGMDHSGQLTLPQSYLDFPPVDGDRLSVRMALLSDNGALSMYHETNSVKYLNESHSLSIGSEYHMYDGYLTIECTKYSGGTTAWISYKNTYDRYGDPGKYVYEKIAEEDTSPGSKRKFITYPPIGVPFTIFLYSRNSNGEWAAERKNFDRYTYNGVEPAAVWNWRDKGTHRLMTAAIYLNVDEIPNLSDERSSEYTTYKTVGRDRPAYYVGKSIERKLDAKGIIFVEGLGYPNLAGATDAQLQELLRVSHALYRSYRGVRAYVTVTGLNVSQSKLEYKEVTVSQYEDGDSEGIF